MPLADLAGWACAGEGQGARNGAAMAGLDRCPAVWAVWCPFMALSSVVSGNSLCICYWVAPVL